MSEACNINNSVSLSNPGAAPAACASKINVALHVHTQYSACSETKPEDMSAYCISKGINTIGVTDHDTIAGAKALHAIAKGIRVIIGSEIRTAQGEIIGLFLKKEIDHGLDALSTCEEIKDQGGLVYLPHPFDPFKIRRLKMRSIMRCLDLIDIIEIFNAKAAFPIFNRFAEMFAERHGKVAAVGSDSHYLGSMDMCLNEMDDFNTPAQFLESLRHASFIKKRSGCARGWWIGIKNVLITEGHKVQRYGRRNAGK